jgi:hypothetical protein
MLDDEINKRIKEAADRYHPGYNEEAWNKMQQMLDEHLPQKRDWRRIFFYFLLAGLLFCGTAYFVYYTTGKKESSGKVATSLRRNVREAGKKTNSHDSNNVVSAQPEKNGSDYGSQTEVVGVSSFRVKKLEKQNDIPAVTHSAAERATGKNSSSNNDFKTGENAVPANVQVNDKYAHSADKNETCESRLPSLKDSQPQSVDNSNDSSTDISEKAMVSKNSGSKASGKKQKEFLKRFGITFSAGPDISGVGVNEVGKVTLLYGAGLRYLLSDRISLRTGFYVSKKIYSAKKKYYKPSAFTYADYYYLQNVDANCNVYEIPITISYNFNKRKNHDWFVSTGLSSYLMKKECYKYYYKYPSGNTTDKSWSLVNRNKHYFSMLDISAGYQYHVNKKLTLSAEPYLKLPLTGIGDGKIRLKSSGLLFSVTLQP